MIWLGSPQVVQIIVPSISIFKYDTICKKILLPLELKFH